MACSSSSILISSTKTPILIPTTATTSTATVANVGVSSSIREGTRTTKKTTARKRELVLSLSAAGLLLLLPATAARAASDEEYVAETINVIGKVRSTIDMDRTDPNVATAVGELREASNFWVSKYRKEKSLLGRISFRDVYSALNAVSGHYVSFGPTAPIPAKRKARILEEVDTAEKALRRGR